MTLAPTASFSSLGVLGVLAVLSLVSCAAPGKHIPPGLESDGGTEPAVDGGLDGPTPDGMDATEAGGAVHDGGATDAGEGGVSTVSCATLPLCDDFESDTPGMPPSAALWSLRNGCSNLPNTPDGGPAIVVDGTVAHGGKNSVSVVNTRDSCGYYFSNTTAFSKLSSQVYARFWARFSGPPTANHNGFLSMETGSKPTPDQLRLGFQGNVVDWNYIPSDSTLPDIDPMGEVQSAPTHPNQWDCIEFHLDQTNGHIEFWLNNLAVPGLSYDGTSTQGVSDQWHTGGPTSLALKDFGLGWLGLNDQYTAWFDDIALASTRIGCQ